jgi:hypothetical protein
MSKTRIAAIAVVVLIVAIQLVPVDRSNPPVGGEVQAPTAVMTVLRESCYDCHSHQTRWPWYAYVAPVSWLVAEDVEHGREHVNFSTWSAYDAEEQAEHIEEIWEEVEDGEMPLRKYLWLHPSARLDESDVSILQAWTQSGSRGSGTDAASAEGDTAGDDGHGDHEH